MFCNKQKPEPLWLLATGTYGPKTAVTVSFKFSEKMKSWKANYISHKSRILNNLFFLFNFKTSCFSYFLLFFNDCFFLFFNACFSLFFKEYLAVYFLFRSLCVVFTAESSAKRIYSNIAVSGEESSDTWSRFYRWNRRMQRKTSVLGVSDSDLACPGARLPCASECSILKFLRTILWRLNNAQ